MSKNYDAMDIIDMVEEAVDESIWQSQSTNATSTLGVVTNDQHW